MTRVLSKPLLAMAAFALGAAAQVASNGERVDVQNITPPGQPHRPSSIQVGAVNSYPAPIPSFAFYQQTFPDRQPLLEIESDIGPYAWIGDTIWFAVTFYDGEGTSGIGAIGSFDVPSRHYEMHYFPEIAPWSGSEMLVVGNDLWIGLKHRPEGPEIGGGLLRYNIVTGAVQTFPVAGVITRISIAAGAVRAETEQGQYLVRDGKLVKNEQPSAK